MGFSASKAVRCGTTVLVSVWWRLRFGGSVRHVALNQRKELLFCNDCVNWLNIIAGRVAGAQGVLAVSLALFRSQARRLPG